jgi:hypothetical protein
MFDGWENFYLMVGSSAAALIGLMFVVVTLTAGRDRAEVERGKRLYTSPIVWNLAVVLVLSGAAIAPNMSAKPFAAVSGGIALLGFVLGMRSAVGIRRRPGAPDSAGFDMFWYGVAPAVVYVGLGACAVAILRGETWGTSAAAADLMLLLLVCIHCEWDLVTFLAPIAGPQADAPNQQQRP